MNKPIANAMLRGIRAQGWHLMGIGGSVTQAIKPLETLMERQVAKAKKADEALLQQALEALVAAGLSAHKTKQVREQAITALYERLEGKV